jgi:hypothetical protein
VSSSATAAAIAEVRNGGLCLDDLATVDRMNFASAERVVNLYVLWSLHSYLAEPWVKHEAQVRKLLFLLDVFGRGIVDAYVSVVSLVL